MLGRKLIFASATVVASALYTGAFYLASDIYLIRANASLEAVERRFQVDLMYVRPDKSFRGEGGDDSGLEPVKTIHELLERETSLMPEVESAPIEPVEIHELQERLDTNSVPREHDFDIDDSVFRGIDARIIEIAEENARKDIDVPRQLVNPSSTRILAKNELPVFRGNEQGVAAGEPIVLPPSVDIVEDLLTAMEESNVPEEPTPQPIGNEAAEVIDEEQQIFHPDIIEPEMAFLPEDTIVARTVVQQEIEEESSFLPMDALVDIQMKVYVDPGTQQGYFELKIVPDSDQVIETLPRDITFVIDASNSIVPRKLQLTVRGVTACLAMLNARDTFNIIVFRGTPTLFNPTMVPATRDTIAQANQFLEGLESSGATDVYSAIQPVIERAPRPGVPGIVFVLTDGRPTAGNLEGRELINALSDENLLGNTIYTFGGGRTVNQYLLDLLAYRNKGRSYTFPRIEEIDEELPRFFAQLNDAYLVGLEADFGRIDENTVFPRQLPDFYKGQVVTLYGRYAPSENEEILIRLEGKSGDKDRDMVLQADLAGAVQGDSAIARNWAFQKVYHLIGEVSRYGETPELMGEIQRLSREFGVRSSYSEN